MSRRSRRTPPNSKPSRIRGLALRLAAVGFLLAIAYGGYLAWTATSEFEGRRWDMPAQVYAAPLELYAGRALSADDLVSRAQAARLPRGSAPRTIPAPTASALGRLELATRGFSFAGDTEPEQLVSIGFAVAGSRRCATSRGSSTRRSFASTRS